MKNKRFIFLLLPLLFTSGCNDPSDPLPGEPTYEEFSTRYTLEASLRKEESTKTGGYDLTFNYKDKFFTTSAKKFNKSLALLSFGESMMTESEETLTRFYQDLHFDNVESHYVSKTGADTVSYMFAHRSINDSNLVALAIRGIGYHNEWINNLELGSSGNHAGFEARALEIYGNLKTYLSNYENTKLWITGYSRGGGISNVLSHIIISRDEINISQDDMYVYTFEAPKGVEVTRKVAYRNVHNVVNSRDLVTYLAPESQYGLARCGVDVDIYSSSVKTILSNFDEDIYIPDFAYVSSSPYQNEKEFIDYFFNTLTQKGDASSGYIYIPTRESYATKMQKGVQTALDIFFSLPGAEINKMVNDVKQNMSDNPSFAYSLLMEEGGVYNFITPYLDEAGYSYNPDSLLEESEALRKFILGKLGLVMLAIGTNSELRNNLTRFMDMHYVEVNYALLSALKA